MNSLQLSNVQVSHSLQMLQLCLDLSFFLHTNAQIYHLPPPLMNRNNSRIRSQGAIVVTAPKNKSKNKRNRELVPSLDDQFEV